MAVLTIYYSVCGANDFTVRPAILKDVLRGADGQAVGKQPEQVSVLDHPLRSGIQYIVMWCCQISAAI